MTIDGHMIQGAQNIIFAQLASPNTTRFSADAARFFSGEFIFMIFGLPGAALAIYRQAKPEKKKAVGGLLFSAALTSMLTGITEPLEFSFLFAAPMLFGIHVILAASAYMAAHILGIAVGLTFSGGLLDLFLFGILQGNAKTNWLLILPAGAVYFLLYYGLFSVLIRSFRLKTPGRLDDPSESESTGSSVSDGCSDPVSAAIVQGLGGFQNISDVDCCATRLRITVHDPAKVREDLLRRTGARGIVQSGQGVQVVYGPKVAVIKSNLEDYLAKTEKSPP